jgi:hypothetical protein
LDGDWSEVRYTVEWCGEPTTIVVTWGDLPEEK